MGATTPTKMEALLEMIETLSSEFKTTETATLEGIDKIKRAASKGN